MLRSRRNFALAFTVPATAAHADAPDASAALREVLFVGNNWDGTAEVIKSTGDFAKIGRINVIPDKDERMAEINADPIRWIAFMTIRNSVGEGHDQFVDDMYSTPDGKSVVVSRPSFADVVSIDLASGRINWRFPVSGYRADHMAVSPDGKRVAVSASTGNTVHVLDIETGRQLGKAATGAKPHENIFTKDGKYIYNMSIGEVNTQTDAPWLDWTKGDRRITVIDATTYQQVKVIDMRPRLDAIGLKDYSDAVRLLPCSRRTSRSCTSRCRSSTASSSTTWPPTRSPARRPCRRTRRPATTAPRSSTTPATTASR